MTIDRSAAKDFMATHARVLDRRRYELLHGDADPAAVVSALDAYRNPDGGYGWGLEPDLRTPESQPGSSHHAFEVFKEIGPATTPQAAALCDWLGTIALPDGGLPFALPLSVTAGSGPWWTSGDPSVSSLQITAVVTDAALRVAEHDPAVAAHPWLEGSTEYLLTAIRAMDSTPFAYALAFSVRFLDALHKGRPADAEPLLERLGSLIPKDGKLEVTGGAEGEILHPLDIAPHAGGAARALFSDEAIAADLDRLANLQQDDGGWIVDFPSPSPVGALEWRGYATVQAVQTLSVAQPA